MVATPQGSADLNRDSIRLRNVGKDLPNIPNGGKDPIMPVPSRGGDTMLRSGS